MLMPRRFTMHWIAADVRVELDDRAEKLGYRMREGQVQKVPYLLVNWYERERGRNRCIPSPIGSRKTTT